MNATKISFDAGVPTASIELMLTKPQPDYDLLEVEAPVPRDVDPMLASQGFLDLLDEVRAVLHREAAAHNLEVVQITGAICHDGAVHRPGIWIVLREKGQTKEMSPEARENVAKIAESILCTFFLS
ncbi:MAG TPA: hypothetical protein VIH97_04230 [Candidatus Acidoferrales bacterium]|jgi:hypothetical protein